MMGFEHVRTWVFDLDNTLYPPEARLFDQIEVRMTDWVMETTGLSRDEASALRRHYWQRYGTTLAGLMREHQIDPARFLHEVHQIDLGALVPDPFLAAGIEALPGRKIVYTNGSAPYAIRVLARREIGHLFNAIYGVENADFRPKPEREAFETIFRADGTDPASAAIFEDDPRNLCEPAAMGMRTTLVGPEPVDEPFIHHHTTDLAAFLHALTRG